MLSVFGVLPLVLALVCVAANAFFVAAEFALAKVRPTSLDALAAQGDARARRAAGLTRHLDAYLSATQLGITLASLGLGWLGEPALAHLIAAPLRLLGASEGTIHGIALAVAFAIISLLHIVIGELVPKSMAIRHPVAVARRTALALRIFKVAMAPALWVLDGASRFVLRAMRMPAPEHAEGTLSAEELRLLIAASGRQGEIPAQKRAFLERVLSHADLPVRSIMRPRVDVVLISLRDDLATQLERIRALAYTRYPVSTDGDPDHIVGYVHVKDLLFPGAPQGPDAVRRAMRELIVVPATLAVGDLIRELQGSRAQIAIIVDEYGGTEGIVTLEDAIEELVGEIQDEHDNEAPRIQPGGEGALLVDGSVPVAELPIEPGDPPIPEDAIGRAIAAYVVHALERLPCEGDRIEVGPWDLEVETVRHRRVRRVRAIRSDRGAPSADDRARPGDRPEVPK